MQDLYRIGENVATGQMDADGLGPAGLAEMLGGAGGADIEKYLQSYEQMLQEGLAGSRQPVLNQVDQEGGVTVQPEPGFVVKTKDANNGTKVFLNVTSNEHIESPHLKTLTEMEGQEGVRVPVSVGTPVEDFDKKGEPCVTYDLIVNPEVVSKCQETPEYRDFVVQLCMSAVGQKYKMELDQRFKLPKLRYKGTTVQYQRIRLKKESMIQELPSGQQPKPRSMEPKVLHSTDAAGKEGSAETEQGGIPRPEFHVFYCKPGSPALDACSHQWGPPPEDFDSWLQEDYVYGLDLPCYHANAFHDRIRGIMMNKAERNAQSPEEKECIVAMQKTEELLAGRDCIVQVSLPNLDEHVAALKQLRIEISDECLRVEFPPLPRTNRAVYSSFTVWWPRQFHSMGATAVWEPSTDMLMVSLPTQDCKSQVEAPDAVDVAEMN
mmetsp:Transcript_28579/g.66215  ORF Transcript_28579/g.66215 Transcript_28579/m.66215 type:complete len:435 (+) Transcript_28579:128-1432(+)